MFTRGFRLALVFGAALTAFGTAGCSSDTKTASSTTKAPSTTTTVKLSGTIVHATMGDANDVSKPMTIELDLSTAPPGDVSFVVANQGKLEHELVVLKTDVPFDQIPVNAAGDPPAPVASDANKILEETNVGETGAPDLKAGESRGFVVHDMVPGNYVVVCNLAKHYEMGVRAAFTVK